MYPVMHLTNARAIIISNKRFAGRLIIRRKANCKGRESFWNLLFKSCYVCTTGSARNWIVSRMFPAFDHLSRKEKSIGNALVVRMMGEEGGGGEGEWGIVTRSVWGESDCCAPIEAVRIVTNVGAARNFQRDRLLSRQYSGGDHRSIPRKDTTQPLSNEKECDASWNRFKGINPSA